MEGGALRPRSLADLAGACLRSPRRPTARRLSAGSFGCSNDLVKALISSQIIPARIEAEIAVCDCIMFMCRKGRNFLQLLERAINLARPGVNQRQIGNEVG